MVFFDTLSHSTFSSLSWSTNCEFEMICCCKFCMHIAQPIAIPFYNVLANIFNVQCFLQPTCKQCNISKISCNLVQNKHNINYHASSNSLQCLQEGCSKLLTFSNIHFGFLLSNLFTGVRLACCKHLYFIWVLSRKAQQLVEDESIYIRIKIEKKS